MFHRGHHAPWVGQLSMPGLLLESTAGSVLESAEAHKIPESVAIGFLAVRLTSGRRAAIAVVLLVQMAMLAGAIFSLSTGGLENRLNLLGVPACACLLFFGLLALREESRLYGRLRAIRVASFAMAVCGVTALALQFVSS